MLITQRIKLSNNNHIPFISGVGELKDNKDFKLWDGRTWNI
jgi:hypothetical protein